MSVKNNQLTDINSRTVSNENLKPLWLRCAGSAIGETIKAKVIGHPSAEIAMRGLRYSWTQTKKSGLVMMTELRLDGELEEARAVWEEWVEALEAGLLEAWLRRLSMVSDDVED